MSNAVSSPRTPAQTMAVQPKSNPSAVAAGARRAKALEILGESLKIDPPMLLTILKNQIMPNATDDEIAAIVIVCNVYDLNPLLREIYAFPDPKRKRIVPVVGVDGWAKIVNRQDDYDGCEFEWQFDDKDAPIACTCKLYHKRRSKPIVVTEYFSECRRGTDPWSNMPKRMLRHKAFIQAVRLAFGVSGIYDEDEARDIVLTDAQVSAAPLIQAPSFITQPSQPAPAALPTEPRVEGNVFTNAPVQDAEPANQEAEQGVQIPRPEPAKTSERPDVTAHLDNAGVLTLIKDLAKRDGVSDDQITAHMRTSKLAKANQQWPELSDSKLRSLANRWDSEAAAMKAISV